MDDGELTDSDKRIAVVGPTGIRKDISDQVWPEAAEMRQNGTLRTSWNTGCCPAIWVRVMIPGYLIGPHLAVPAAPTVPQAIRDPRE